MLHTGRPSSAFETGLLGFSNEYYREFTEDSSTLRSFFASVLSSGATESRGEAINGLLTGDGVRAAYADEEMDENKVGCYREVVAMLNVADADRVAFSAGQTYDSAGSNFGLYSAKRTVTTNANAVRSGAKLPGKWVALQDGTIRQNTLADGVILGNGFVSLWHRYE